MQFPKNRPASLEAYRAEIDRLDDEIFSRLEVRAEMVFEIQLIKRELGLSTWDMARVNSIEARVARLAPRFSRGQIARLVLVVAQECLSASQTG